MDGEKDKLFGQEGAGGTADNTDLGNQNPDGTENSNQDPDNIDAGEKDPANIDENELDDKNVPYKNRVAEERRKREAAEKRSQEAEKRFQEMEAILQSEKEKVRREVNYEKEEEEYKVDQGTLKAIDKKAAKIAAEMMSVERQADAQVEAYLEKKMNDIPQIAKVYKRIKAELTTIPPLSRIDTRLMDMIIHAKIGEYSLENPQRQNNNPNPVQRSKTVLESGATSNSGGNIVLTEEEIEFANGKKLFDKDFTNTEIRKLYSEINKIKNGGTK